MPLSTTIDDRTYEQSVAEVAINALKSRFPELLPYALAFQLVDRSDDDTRALGFFGFRVGELLIYVPVFFVKGDIKGINIGYIPEEDRFIPLTEDWINNILRRFSFTIGESSQRDTRRDGISGPDLRRLRIPPTDAKIASSIPVSINYGFEKVDEFSAPAKQMFESAYVSPPTSVPELVDVVAYHNITEPFLENVKKSPKLASAVFEFYKPEDFLQAFEARQQFLNVEKSAAENPSQPSVLVADATDIYLSPSIGNFLSAEEKSRIARGEIVIKDFRKTSAVRTVFEDTTTLALHNPNTVGIYRVFLKNQEFDTRLVIPTTYQHLPDLRFVINQKNTCDVLKKQSLWCKSEEIPNEEKKEFIEKIGIPVSKVKASDFTAAYKNRKAFCIVQADGSSSYGPFIVRAQNDSSSITVVEDADQLVVSVDDSISEIQYLYSFSNMMRISWTGVKNPDHSRAEGPSSPRVFDYVSTSSKYPRTSQAVIFVDKAIARPIVSGSTLIVGRPSDYYVIFFSENMDSQIAPADNPDIQIAVQNSKAMKLSAYFDGNQYWISIGRQTQRTASKKAACEILCRNWSLSGDDALHILNTAESAPRKKFSYYVKEASDFDVPDFDARFEPTLGAPVQAGGLSVEKLLESGKSFDPAAALVYRHFKDENNYSALYQKDIDMLNKAVRSGQKEIFNAAAIAALANVKNIDEEISSYIPALIRALDRLGRLLTLFYWHYDELIDRYGNIEAKSLQEDLENVFAELGDVVIRIRKNAPQMKDIFGSGIIGGDTN